MSNRRHFGFATAPGLALGLALGLAAVGGAACQSDDEQVFDPGDGTLQGELATYIADDFERGVQTTQYAIRSASGLERWLDFDSDPGIEPGTRIKVRGTQLGERMHVSSVTRLARPLPTQTIRSALRNGTKFPAKRLAFVIIDIGMGSNITPENALREIVGPSTNTDPPLRNYYAETSYGTEELDGQVFGPFTYNIGSCATSGMPTMFRAMVDQMGGGTFNNYLWYIGSRTSACSWSGLGEVGTPMRPANDTWYNGSSSCVVMIQEPGHNFGMQHSSSMDCGSVSFNDTPNGNCTHGEYGDRYDPMGGGCKHMNAWQKTYNGWLQGCNMVRVRSSGTFTLVPLELGCDGAQVLQIPAPKTRTFMRSGGGGSATNDMLTHYYLELRTRRGVDATGNAPVPTSVQVRISGDIRGRADRGLHTWILDMDPASSNFDGLLAGRTFEDPAGGVSFTVTELDENHATVNVTMTANGGGPVCMDGTTAFTAPGPGLESCNAGISTPGGGIGGAGGVTGTAGTTGTGGRGGTTGMAGRGGTTGMAGTTGTAGTTGMAGTTGAGGNVPIGGRGGTTGMGGTTGQGGTTGEAGTTGNGGAPPTGTAGTTGIKPPNPVTGGCACDVGEGGRGNPMLLLALAFGLRAARRFRRSSRLRS